MTRDWQTYGNTEYSLHVSLRSRPGRAIVVFRVDTRLGHGEYRTVYLDRAETPVRETVWAEWANVIDNFLTNAMTHRYGLQPELITQPDDAPVEQREVFDHT